MEVEVTWQHVGHGFHPHRVNVALMAPSRPPVNRHPDFVRDVLSRPTLWAKERLAADAVVGDNPEDALQPAVCDILQEKACDNRSPQQR
jgi:hypothetical protein